MFLKSKTINSIISAVIAVLIFCGSAPAAQFGPFDSETKDHMQSWGFPHKEGVVLALCGGGIKGLAHVGIFRELEKNNIPIAAIIGTSMGAIMGGLYCSGWTPEEMEKTLSKVDMMEVMSGRAGANSNTPGYNRPAAVDDHLFAITLDKDKNEQGRLGVLNAKDLYSFLSDLTSNVAVTDFDELKIPFAAVATNLGTGDTVILRNGNLASALRGSMSIPVVFDPWPMNGMLLVDGGLKANLPVLEAQRLFPGHPVIAINLSNDDITRKNQSFQSMFDVAEQTLDILMVSQIRQNLEAADLVITPDLKGLSTFSAASYQNIIEKGAEAADAAIPQIKELIDKKCQTWDHSMAGVALPMTLTVAEVRFEGIPDEMAEELHSKYESWIGKPLDMKLVAETVSIISKRQDVKSVDGHTVNLSRSSVEVVFQIERPAKYAFGLDGYASNLNPNRWISVSALAHDTFMQGDTASLEARLGTHWGGMLRYFTMQNEADAQWGLVLGARQEKYEPDNFAESQFERYTAKAAWYKNIGSRGRLGLGYAAQRVTSLGPDSIDDHGPYLSYNFNTLDDPIMPSSGLVFDTELWYRVKYNLVSDTRFRVYVPLFKKNKVVMAGGLKTGDASDLAYAAMLGPRQEMYSLGNHPLIGDQAYWLHLGFERVFMRSWWGGVNLELFGNYGQVFSDWTNSGSRWEVGAALSIPTNNFNGKLILVYGDDGGFTIGYSIGIPRFWDGPLP